MNIPEVLKREKRFVCHDEFKRPINPHTGRFASVTNSNTWGSFQEAILYVNDKKAIGIGFVLGDGFVGIDIDTCIDKESGAISEEALENITILDSYTEISNQYEI